MLFRRLFKNPSTLEPAVSDAGMRAPAADSSETASAAVEQGRYAEALASIDHAAQRAPDDPRHAFARARTLYAWNRFHEAREACLRAVELRLEDDALFRMLAWSSLWTWRFDDALMWSQKALDVAPREWANRFARGATLHVLGRLDDAIAAQREALEVRPDSVDSLNSLVVCHLDKRDAAAAEAEARKVLAIDDRQAIAWANLGVALGRQGRVDEAREPFERAMRLEAETGDVVDSFVNFCNYLRDNARNAEAIAVYERTLPERPSMIAYGDYAFSLLAKGRFREGWTFYEFRWMKDAFLSTRPDFGRPVWSGQDLAGKTILLRVEQGFGDIFQFARYAPMVKALGATVLLMLRPGVDRIMRSCPGIDRILDRSEPIPPFDYYIHLMSLPRVFGTELESIPARVPYLHPDEAAVSKWKDRLPATAKPRIGVVWAGSPAHPNDFYRSTSLAALAGVLRTPGVQFVSLQKGAAAEATSSLEPSVDWLDPTRDFDDFCDTAAVIAELDLVICVDTSVAHLAGAMGKPVWLLLPTPADFRWLEDREDSPWYPTMRLFRQSRRGHWDDVMRRLESELAEWVRDRAVGPRSIARSGDAGPCLPAPETAVLDAVDPRYCGAGEVRAGVLQYFRDEPIVGPSLAFYGEALQAQLDLLAAMVRPGDVVLEVPAGVGVHALPIARMVESSGHVFVVEPRPRVYRVLRQNLASNRVTNVTMLTGDLGSPAEAAASPPPRKAVDFDAGRVADPEDRIDTLDGLRLARLDWLKINDADAAQRVIEGAAETLWRLRPCLLIRGLSPDTLPAVAQRVQAFGYRCWRHDSGLFNPDNFHRRRVDVFDGARACALLAIPEEREVRGELPLCTPA